MKMSAILMVAMLAGCVNPGTPPITPPPDFLTMCSGDEACVLQLEYDYAVQSAALETAKLEAQQRAFAYTMQGMANAFGGMANASRPSAPAQQMRRCYTTGNFERCTYH